MRLPFGDGKIAAVTLHQPYASAVALGLKTIETRSWPTNHRGSLAIHAGKNRGRELQEFFGEVRPHFRRAGFAGGFDDLPFGAVVAIVDLYDCRQVERIDRLSSLEATFGNYSPGRFGWLFRDLEVLPEPIPARGYQQIWLWERP